MSKLARVCALLLCIILVFTTAFSLIIPSLHHAHACPGDHCSVCLLFSHTTGLLQQLKFAVIAALHFAVVICSILLSCKCRIQGQGLFAPVHLKVQLNN
jgi:hypothetical protein